MGTLLYEGPGKVLDRSRQARWDRRRLRTVSTHLMVHEARQLKQICRDYGISTYHLLHWFLLSVIRKPECLRNIMHLIRREQF